MKDRLKRMIEEFRSVGRETLRRHLREALARALSHRLPRRGS